MKVYQLILLFLLILVPLMAILSIFFYKLEDPVDISAVKCICLTATLLNLFISVKIKLNNFFY